MYSDREIIAVLRDWPEFEGTSRGIDLQRAYAALDAQDRQTFDWLRKGWTQKAIGYGVRRLLGYPAPRHPYVVGHRAVRRLARNLVRVLNGHFATRKG